MQFKDIQNKPIALLVWNTDQKDDVHVYIGEIVEENSRMLFINISKGWRVSLDEEQMGRITKVTEETREIFLGAEYFIPMYMTSLPDDSKEGFDPTGLNWH